MEDESSEWEVSELKPGHRFVVVDASEIGSRWLDWAKRHSVMHVHVSRIGARGHRFAPILARLASLKLLELDWETTGLTDKSLGFLDLFGDLDSLSLTGPSGLDWGKINGFSGLQKLQLFARHDGGVPREVDLTRLKKLRFLSLPLFDTWRSAVSTTTLTSLLVFGLDSWKGKGPDFLDCSASPGLRRLAVQDMWRLKDVALAKGVQLEALWLDSVVKLRFEPMITNAMRHFYSRGRLGSPWQVLGNAENLISLELDAPGRIGSIEFLRELKALKKVMFGLGHGLSAKERKYIEDRRDTEGWPVKVPGANWALERWV